MIMSRLQFFTLSVMFIFFSCVPSLCSSFTILTAPLQSSKTSTNYNVLLHMSPTEEEIEENLEVAWRHVKKPLLRIGGKGVTKTHGNSLRELLQAHTAVKVKINTKDEGKLETLVEELMTRAQESSGGNDGKVEFLQGRASENMVLLGLEGTMDMIREGTFPPQETDDED